MPEIKKYETAKRELVRWASTLPGLDYSFMAGGITQTQDPEYKGDCDTLTVLKSVTEETRTAVFDFLRGHLTLQESLGLKPDYDFPIELGTSEQVRQAAQGRGLRLDAEGRLMLKSEDVADFPESLDPSKEADFSYWLYMLITSNGLQDHLGGSVEHFQLDVREAIATTFLLAADQNNYLDGGPPMRIPRIREDIFKSLKEANHAYRLSDFHTVALMQELERRGMAQIEEGDRVCLSDDFAYQLEAFKLSIQHRQWPAFQRAIDFQEMWEAMGRIPDWHVERSRKQALHAPSMTLDLLGD